MAKLRHIAMSVEDPEKTADFYCEAFDMERVGKTDSPLAKGCYVSDGVITVALLKYKTDQWAGYVEGEDERGKDYVGLHHIGFWVDDAGEADKKIEKAGGKVAPVEVKPIKEKFLKKTDKTNPPKTEESAE